MFLPQKSESVLEWGMWSVYYQKPGKQMFGHEE